MDKCSSRLELEATSGPDGAFALGSVPHGRATFLVQHPKYAQERFDRTLPDPLQDVVLDAGASWNGRVYDPDGRLLETCAVHLSLKDYLVDHPVETSGACSRAGFAFERLPPGKYQLRVHVNGDPQMGSQILEKVVSIQPRERRKEDVHWPAGGTIAGRVVATDGKPVAGVAIRAKPASHAYLHDGSSLGVETTSDPEGHFILRHLRFAGPWTLHFSSTGRGWTEVKVNVGTTDAAVTMPP